MQHNELSTLAEQDKTPGSPTMPEETSQSSHVSSPQTSQASHAPSHASSDTEQAHQADIVTPQAATQTPAATPAMAEDQQPRQQPEQYVQSPIENQRIRPHNPTHSRPPQNNNINNNNNNTNDQRWGNQRKPNNNPNNPADNTGRPSRYPRENSTWQQKKIGTQQPERTKVGPQTLYNPLSGPDKLKMEELLPQELIAYARILGIVGSGHMKRAELLERIQYVEAHPEMEMPVEGVLEKLPDGFGFLRSALYDYISGPDDVYVSPTQIRRLGLRTGDTIKGIIRKPKEGEKYFALLTINTINDADSVQLAGRPSFETLTPEHPHKKFNLEFDPTALSTRILDIFSPIGKGQRGLIVAPPKVGKTLLLKELTRAIIAQHPEVYLIVLLIDERPEEVSDMRKTVKGAAAEVISSTFDESSERHVQVTELVLEKAKRLVECGKDVVILLDSITRLARAYNTNAPASGKVLTGGIDANALQWPKRFFGAARSTEEAGSLTIIATAMVDTGSRMEEVIYEEFKGTGNMEIHMSRKLSNRRIYPAFDLLVSGTRRDELLHTPEDLNKVWVLQKFLGTMNTIEGMEFLIDKMKKSKTNREFLDSINKKQE